MYNVLTIPNKERRWDKMSGLKFELGRLCYTEGVANDLTSEDAADLLYKHSILDPGILYEEDQAANRSAIEEGDRILSAFEVRGIKYYVITEWDRSATTILRADEY